MAHDTLIVLVTGVSGSGKTSVAHQLNTWDHVAVSLDGYKDLCCWTDHDGKEVQRPPHPPRSFLETHHWTWREPLLDKLIGDVRGIGVNTVWLTGVAANLPQLRDRFDWTILLHVDTDTIRERLRDSRRGNDFGRVGDSLDYLTETAARQQHDLRNLCDAVVDATVDPIKVAENVLAEGALGWLARTRPAGPP